MIDPGAKSDPGFNHIGDITWDAHEGGRIVLPLECYDPSKQPANTCGIGGFGIADPDTLQWKYWVKLDPADIPKAMWAESSPDGKLIWTSTGDDLIAYDARDVVPGNAQPAGPAIRPVKRLVGAVPAHGITGAVFVGPRLFVAGQDGARFRVSSIDLTDGRSRIEIEKRINGESEGLDTFDGARRQPALDGHAGVADRPADLRARQGHAAQLQGPPHGARPGRQPAAREGRAQHPVRVPGERRGRRSGGRRDRVAGRQAGQDEFARADVHTSDTAPNGDLSGPGVQARIQVDSRVRTFVQIVWITLKSGTSAGGSSRLQWLDGQFLMAGRHG